MASAIGLIGTIGDAPCRPQGVADGGGLFHSEVGVIVA